MKVKQWLCGVAACVMTLISAQTAQAQMGPWTGLYLGVNAGYGWGVDSNPSTDGFLAGMYAGYNWQFGSAVLGVEGDYSFASLESGAANAAMGSVVDIDAIWSLRTRLGFTPTNNLLIYATVGYGGFQTRMMSTAGNINDTQTGLAGGGGLEFLFSQNITGRVETLWYAGNGSDVAATDVGTVRLGLAYKF